MFFWPVAVVFAGDAAEIEVTAASAAPPIAIAVPSFFMSGSFRSAAAYAAGIMDSVDDVDDAVFGFDVFRVFGPVASAPSPLRSSLGRRGAGR